MTSISHRAGAIRGDDGLGAVERVLCADSEAHWPKPREGRPLVGLEAC